MNPATRLRTWWKACTKGLGGERPAKAALDTSDGDEDAGGIAKGRWRTGTWTCPPKQKDCDGSCRIRIIPFQNRASSGNIALEYTSKQ